MGNIWGIEEQRILLILSPWVREGVGANVSRADNMSLCYSEDTMLCNHPQGIQYLWKRVVTYYLPRDNQSSYSHSFTSPCSSFYWRRPLYVTTTGMWRGDISDTQVKLEVLEGEWELCKKQEDQKRTLIEVNPVPSPNAYHTCSPL